ncbi:MAG: DUF3488 and transglutaminase-like domain-containing protein [Planctomycetota bacterium]
MDLNRVKTLRLLLTAHFAVIAWLTAMLVASGSGSILLPVLIFFCSLTAFIFVDYLEKFELKSFMSAIAMTFATGAAIAQYAYSVVNSSEEGQLMAVAGLLVYPEAVLFFQRKNLRVFEQLAVFLLLEMVVAALVNDNLFFGLMLAPIMLIWVSSLFLFSRYATLAKIDPSIETQQPKLAELLFRRFMKTMIGEGKKKPIVSSQFVAAPDVQHSRTFRRTLQSVPIGLGALVFAGLFFYLVPRVNDSNFGSALGSQASIGLPNRLTFGTVSRLLQNPAAVMRVTFRDRLTQEAFRPEMPPYLRANVFDRYGRTGRRKGEWSPATPSPRKLGARKYSPKDRRSLLTENQTADEEKEPKKEELVRLKDLGREPVLVDFDLRPEFEKAMFTVPPIFPSPQRQRVNLTHDPRLMLLMPLDSSTDDDKKAVAYQFLSSGFLGTKQSSVAPAKLTEVIKNFDKAYENLANDLVEGFEGFDRADAFREELIATSGINPKSKISIAMEIERTLAFSGNFGYTLDLKPPTDSDLDPIEDFLVNKRVGHCQYFASAMVCLLRQSGIPSRLVIGYRPTEFNTLGDYFTVRQRDAHAWVEAIFTHADLENSIFRDELTEDQYYWVRFDPTPPPDGELEITEQDGQAMDYAEKLWQEYVVEGQNLASDGGIYAPVAGTNTTYAGMVERLKNALVDFQNGNNFGSLGAVSPIAILVTILIMGLVLVWQFTRFLPRIAPRWALRLGIVRNTMDIHHPFYARCLKILSKLGVKRSLSATPAEYAETASKLLEERGNAADQSVSFLTAIYYRLRFGREQNLTEADQQRIKTELNRVEEAVAAAKKSG